jgi:predicted Zn-dependent peptidase
MYQVTRLPNGLTVATAAMPHMASVSVGLWVGVGGRYEPPALNGVSHFIEHMLFKGTRRRSARAISESVEGAGGYLNAFTSEDHTCFYARSQHHRFGELLDVLVDMLLHSRFDPADVNKEREVIKEELAMYRDQPQQQVQEILNEILWPDHALGRPLTGTERTLDGIGRAELLDFLAGHYTAATTLVAVAGRVTHREAVTAVSRYARHFPAGHRLQSTPFEGRQAAPRLRLVTRRVEQTQLALGMRACSRHDPRRYAARLLNILLGENMSSRLFQELREERGLAYSVYSTISGWEDVGSLDISAGIDAEQLPRVLRLVTRELRRCRDAAPTRAELRRARDYAIGQLRLSLENTESQMTWVGERWLGYGRIEPASATERAFAAVTPAQVRAVAQAFFRPERLSLALVSPLKSTAGLERLLRI